MRRRGTYLGISTLDPITVFFSVVADLIASCSRRCVKQSEFLLQNLPRGRDLGLLTRPHSSSNRVCREGERPSTGTIPAARSPNYLFGVPRQTVLGRSPSLHTRFELEWGRVKRPRSRPRGRF